jgi:maleate isomerase
MYGPKRANDGYRARVGIILPSVNTVMEAWFPRAVPEGVSFHTARIPLAGDECSNPLDALDQMAKYEIGAAKMLVDCECDVIMYVCTAATLMRGRAYDLALMRKITAETGIPCCTVTHAILQALEHFSAQRLSIISPYSKAIEEREAAFFTQCGLEVLNIEGLGIDDGREMADPSPGEVYRFARSAWRPSSDALLISCGAMRAHYIAGALERDIGAPVISSTTATLWAALRLAGVMDPLPGYGRLLEEACRPIDLKLGTETLA